MVDSTVVECLRKEKDIIIKWLEDYFVCINNAYLQEEGDVNKSRYCKCFSFSLGNA